ncbi:MAG TPA: ATP-dependent DNA helicase RecG [Gemmatimonadaceae bacterium]|nr:ATP-dependent DNA helicase RecG [Gemmatimonadaceae bacterium]
MPPSSRPSSSRADPARRLPLDTPIRFVKGVGDRRADALHRLGIHNAGDLLYHVPYRYEDASTIVPIASLQPGMDATALGRVISKGILPTRKGLRIFQVVLKDSSGMIEAAFPGQPFLDKSIDKNDVLLVSGPVRFFHGRQLVPREYVNLGEEDSGDARGRVLAVYRVTETITVRQMRSLIDRHLDGLLAEVREHLPNEIRAAGSLPMLGDALRAVHRPTSLAEAEQGRTRLAFDELLFDQLLHLRANELAREPRHGIRFENKRTLTTRLREGLPFTLTGAQTQAVREIVADMSSERRMHRLLQGDVGSGKTIVAVFAALLAMENDYQACLMAPTELLAEQHARSITRLLQPLGIAPLLVTGSLSTRERRELDDRLASSEPAFVIGTHALVQERTRFARLGLAIVDEQHRFGVEQRAALGAKGARPDVLLLSATPIPRSLALTLYGDLDVTVLRERPPGRLRITTALRPESARAKVLQFVRQQVEEGRQAYIVYPVIDESEKVDLKAATTMYANLAEGALKGLRLGLMHGRLDPDERDRLMRQFQSGELDVLIATTVIEVGIDIPNATVMLIEHPERFGLSQLHQLRGRVGRGAEASYCILMGDVGHDAYQRLSILARTDDGFEIARADLRLRGMGELFGERQSGAPTFRIADPLRDEAQLVAARAFATQILAADPRLSAPHNAGLRRVLRERYTRALELFQVG